MILGRSFFLFWHTAQPPRPPPPFNIFSCSRQWNRLIIPNMCSMNRFQIICHRVEACCYVFHFSRWKFFFLHIFIGLGQSIQHQHLLDECGRDWLVFVKYCMISIGTACKKSHKNKSIDFLFCLSAFIQLKIAALPSLYHNIYYIYVYDRTFK